MERLLSIISLLLISISVKAQWKEADFVVMHCQGMQQYKLADGDKVDCLTDTHAIEYSWSGQWLEPLRHSQQLSAATGRKPGLVLICKNHLCEQDANRAREAAPQIEIWVINQ